VQLFNTTRFGMLRQKALYHMDGGVTDGPRLRQRIEVHTIGGIDSGEAATLHLYYMYSLVVTSRPRTQEDWKVV
jgi:hypothetical protein